MWTCSAAPSRKWHHSRPITMTSTTSPLCSSTYCSVFGGSISRPLALRMLIRRLLIWLPGDGDGALSRMCVHIYGNCVCIKCVCDVCVCSVCVLPVLCAQGRGSWWCQVRIQRWYSGRGSSFTSQDNCMTDTTRRTLMTSLHPDDIITFPQLANKPGATSPVLHYCFSPHVAYKLQQCPNGLTVHTQTVKWVKRLQLVEDLRCNYYTVVFCFCSPYINQLAAYSSVV